MASTGGAGSCLPEDPEDPEDGEEVAVAEGPPEPPVAVAVVAEVRPIAIASTGNLEGKVAMEERVVMEAMEPWAREEDRAPVAVERLP